jgi:hypothetical protein
MIANVIQQHQDIADRTKVGVFNDESKKLTDAAARA